MALSSPDGFRLIREGDRFIGFEPSPTTAALDKMDPLLNVGATVSESSIDLQVVALLPTAPAADDVIEHFRGQAPSVTKIAQVVLGDGIRPDEILPAIDGKSIYFALTRRGVSKGTVLAGLGYELWAHDQSLPANSDVIIGYGSKSGVDHVARGLTDSSGSLQDVYAFIPQGPQVVQHDIGQPYRYWVRTRRSMAA